MPAPAHVSTAYDTMAQGATFANKQNPFRGFRGAHDPGRMGLAATAWVPMGAGVPVWSPHDHPNPSRGRQKGFGKGHVLEIFWARKNGKKSDTMVVVVVGVGGEGAAPDHDEITIHGSATVVNRWVG